MRPGIRAQEAAAGPLYDPASFPPSVVPLREAVMDAVKVTRAALAWVAAGALAGGVARAESRVPPVATFSIVGYDSTTGEMGAAVQSRVFAVGNGVLWAEAGVGVVATQAWVDVGYGPRGIDLLRKGTAPQAVVERLLRDDPDPFPEDWPEAGRQFCVMDARGRFATHTGPKASNWAGHRIGRHCSAQGNILAGPAVVDDMVRAFETTSGHLSLRLLAALEAGQAAGGDTRGMQSAAMLIVQKDGGVWLHNDVVLRLHVDDNPEPIAELHRLVEKASEHRAMSRGYWQEMEAKAKARPKK